ncbi:MAG TPA: folate-binding protein [Actinocatenispora sp.]
MLDVSGAVAADPDRPDAGVAVHYGDPMREQRTLATAAGLVDRSDRGVLTVPGADRLSWLHTLGTQHLERLADGTGTELLLLSPHGHIEHHAVATEYDGVVWLDTEPGAAGPLLAFLDSMRFMLRVEPTDVTADWAVASLVGPDAPAVLAKLGVELPAPRVAPVPPAQFATGAVPPAPTSTYPVAGLPGGGFARRMPAFGDAEVIDLVVPRGALAGLADTLGVPLAGAWAYEALRVAARRPRLGRDTDHRTIPAEVGFLSTAVHLDKGCYRGQETVARVHNLGRPPRRTVLLHLDGTSEELPAPGTPVLRDDRAVGVVGTAVRHFELGMVALALLKKNVPDDAPLHVGDVNAAVDPE